MNTKKKYAALFQDDFEEEVFYMPLNFDVLNSVDNYYAGLTVYGGIYAAATWFLNPDDEIDFGKIAERLCNQYGIDNKDVVKPKNIEDVFQQFYSYLRPMVAKRIRDAKKKQISQARRDAVNKRWHSV